MIKNSRMLLRVERTYPKENYCIGKFYVDGSYMCNSLEDTVRDLAVEPKIYGKTAIPYGTYRVILDFSNRFQRIMPHILNVPHFEGIRIHGSKSELATEVNTEGCIILGRNSQKGKLSETNFYFNMLMSLLTDATKKKQEITITIV